MQFDEQTDVLAKAAVQRVVDAAEAARHAGFDVQLGGTPIGLVVTAAPGPSEGIGVTAAMLILLIAFGSVVAMGLPILTALFGLADRCLGRSSCSPTCSSCRRSHRRWP